MADFTSKRPVEQVKEGAFLHDRSNRPRAPRAGRDEMVQRYLPLALGIVLALALMAAGFQARAAWESHREWVVAVFGPVLVVGGVALGHLLARREWNSALLPMFCLVGVALMAALDVFEDAKSDPDEALRDGLAIGMGALLGLLALTAVLGAAWVEWKRPSKAPAPEM